MDNDQCYWHGYEPLPAKYYIVCGECYHVFVTPEELVEAFNASKPPGCPEEFNVSEIFFCPLCVHDF